MYKFLNESQIIVAKLYDHYYDFPMVICPNFNNPNSYWETAKQYSEVVSNYFSQEKGILR